MGLREACQKEESFSLSRHAEIENIKKHRVIRWDIVSILQSLDPGAVTLNASPEMMVSYGNCR